MQTTPIPQRTLVLVCGLALAGLWLGTALTVTRAAPSVQAPGCTISWAAPVDGGWTDPTKWNPAREPVSSDHVCITVDGTYTVNLGLVGGGPTIAGLTLQNSPAGTATLHLGLGTLHVTGDVDNAETINPGNYSSPAGGFWGHLIVDGTLTNRGLIDGTGDGPELQVATLINEPAGVIKVSGVSSCGYQCPIPNYLNLTRPGATYINRGTIRSGPDNRIAFSGDGLSFTQESGTIQVEGVVGLSGGVFTYNGGTISGVLDLTNATLVTGPNAGAASFILNGGTMASDLRSGYSLRLRGTVTLKDGMNNAGAMLLEGSALVAPGGLLNAPGGVIEAVSGVSSFQGDLDNRGTLRLNANFIQDRSATYTNTGTITIFPGARLALSGPFAVFNQNGGVINNSGTFDVANGTFNFTRGTINGNALTLSNAHLALGPSAGNARFVQTGANSTLSGSIRTGHELTVRDGKLTVSGDLNNAGVLDTTGSGGVDILIKGGALTNTEAGIVRARNTAGTRVTGPIVNSGTIAVTDGDLSYNTPDSAFSNVGVITIGNGRTLTIASGVLVNQGNGITGGGTLRIEPGAALTGNGRLAVGVVNNGTINPGGPAAAGRLEIAGDYTQANSGRLTIEIGGRTAGAQFDQLAVTGSSALDGTLNYQLVDGFVPAAGDQFPLLTFGAYQGSFSTVTGQTGSFVKTEASLTATALTVSVTEVTTPPAPPWLVLLYLAGDDVPPKNGKMTGLSKPLNELLDRLKDMPYNDTMRLVVLYDGDQPGDTRIYVRQPGGLLDITEQAAVWPNWTGQGLGPAGAREANTGSYTTLRDFIKWARATYPGSRYTMLSIVDHGGGWAPDLDLPGQPRGLIRVQSGGWRGMSLDMHSGGSTLATRNISQALQGQQIDLLFFDACLMGMLETAYEVHELADYLVAGENLLFAQLPYEDYLAPEGLTATSTPRELASRIVDLYNNGLSPAQFPFTIAALDLRQLRADVPDNLGSRVNTLAGLLLAALPDPAPADHPLVLALKEVYSQAQKFDYDNNLKITEREGYVDLVDFARRLSTSANPAIPPEVKAAAAAVAHAALQGNVSASGGTPVVVKQRAVSGSFAGNPWDFAGASGLSIFLPLGERDYRPTLADETDLNKSVQAERQLQYYLDPAQLAFTRDRGQWAALLERLEPAVPRIRTGPGGLPAMLAAGDEIIDTSPFSTPFPVRVKENTRVLLPLVIR